MRRMFVSDAHVGDFASRIWMVMDAIKAENPDELYLIGDTIDLWKDSLETIKERYSPFFSMLLRLPKEVRVCYVLGNHDEKLDKDDPYFGRVEFHSKIEMLIGGKKAKVIHGHEYDPLITKFYPVSRFLSFIHKIFLRLFGIDLRRFRFSLSSHKKAKNFKEVISKVRDRAVQDAGCHGYDILIMGHTHLPEKTQIGQVLYVNMGDWVTSYTYVIENEGDICLVHSKNS